MTTELGGLDLTAVWGAGDDIFAAGQGATIVHSPDHGVTWSVVDTSAAAGAGSPVYQHIAGSGGDDVWLAGTVGAQSLLLHSADRGASWQQRAAGDAQGMTSVWAFDRQQVLVATRTGDVFRSEDGAASWSRVVTGAGDALYALWGSPSGYMYAVGGRDAPATAPEGSTFASNGCDGGVAGEDAGSMDEGVMLRSTDFGRTWATIGVAPAGTLWNVWGTASGSVVAASGEHESSAVSFDSGVTWTADGRPVSPIDLTNVWVGADDGSILFTSPTGVVTAVEYSCAGPVAVEVEPLPRGASGATGTVALWGAGLDDLWAVGPGGIIRRRH